MRAHLLSNKGVWYRIIFTLSLIAVATVFTVEENAYPIVYIRYLFGSFFVLLLPGYSLIKALFPVKGLDNIERLGLSIAMSIALVPLVGLLLNYTPWGMRIVPVTFSFLALTTIFATFGLVREEAFSRGNRGDK